MKKSKSKFVGVLGGGGRESAFIESLLSDSSVETIFVFHPNGGFANEPRVHKLTLASGTSSEIVKLCKKNEITLVLSGPEAMAIEGVNDALIKAGVSVLGASAKAIQIESDKSWAREFMQKIGLPQPEYLSFTDSKEAIKAATENEKLRVVKAIGPALGKGVIVCDTLADVKKGIKTILVDQKFGDAGKKVVLEERLGWNDPDAQEISVMFYCDGHQLLALPLAQDYKRENDGDQGENTGGVGSHTSPNILSAKSSSFTQAFVRISRFLGWNLLTRLSLSFEA